MAGKKTSPPITPQEGSRRGVIEKKPSVVGDLFQYWVGETERNNAVLPDDEHLKSKLDKIAMELIRKAVYGNVQ